MIILTVTKALIVDRSVEGDVESKLASKRPRRFTKQRQMIVEVLRQTRAHPDAVAIYDEVRKYIPNISLGTVYRILSDLRESGEILELSSGNALRRFDGRTEHHYHITCLSCDKMADVEMPIPADFHRQASVDGYEVVEHRLEFLGYCPACRAAQREQQS